MLQVDEEGVKSGLKSELGYYRRRYQPHAEGLLDSEQFRN